MIKRECEYVDAAPLDLGEGLGQHRTNELIRVLRHVSFLERKSAIPLNKLPLIDHLHPQLLRLRQLAARLLPRHEEAGVLADAAGGLAAEDADALLDLLARKMLEAAGGDDGHAGQRLLRRRPTTPSARAGRGGGLHLLLRVDPHRLELLDGVAAGL